MARAGAYNPIQARGPWALSMTGGSAVLHLTTREIMDIAVMIEKNGSAFYDSLLSVAKNEDAKAIYEFMAEEERQHITDFQTLAENVKALDLTEASTSEQNQYLEALVSTHMFAEEGAGAKMAAAAVDDIQALTVAMRFEKDSILLFDMLKELVPERDKPSVEALIRQERQHLLKLALIREAIKTP